MVIQYSHELADSNSELKRIINKISLWIYNTLNLKKTKISILTTILNKVRSSCKSNLDTLIITLLGLEAVIDNMDIENQKKCLTDIKKLKNYFIRLEVKLDKTNFLEDQELKIKWNQCLDSIFDLESNLRKKTYSNIQKENTDKGLILELNKKSKNAIGHALSKHG